MGNSREKLTQNRANGSNNAHAHMSVTIPKLTCWVRGANSSTFARKTARAQQIIEPKWPETELGPLPTEEGTTCEKIDDFHLKSGSSQGQNLAVTVLILPDSLDKFSRLHPAPDLLQVQGGSESASE